MKRDPPDLRRVSMSAPPARDAVGGARVTLSALANADAAEATTTAPRLRPPVARPRPAEPAAAEGDDAKTGAEAPDDQADDDALPVIIAGVAAMALLGVAALAVRRRA